MGLSDVVRGLLTEEQSSGGADRESPSLEEASATESTTVVYECRSCGTTVSPDETCPTCGSTAIAEYPVD